MECEMYLFMMKDSTIAIEAENKTKAIETFKCEFFRLYNSDWEIKRISTVVTLNGEFKRY